MTRKKNKRRRLQRYALAMLSGRRIKKPGLVPGTLVHAGPQKAERVRITVIDYDEAHFEEKEVQSVEECFAFRAKPTITWINVDGLHDVSVIEKLGLHYGIHPLLLEDILHPAQRPKAEDFQNYVYIVLRMLTADGEDGAIVSEQVSIVVGDNFVITFQETPGDVFDPIRDRIRTDKGRIRKMGADYLAYSLLDIIVDHYFVVLERVGERIAAVEDEVVTRPTTETIRQMHGLKNEMIFLRRSVWPLREVVSSLERGESVLFSKNTLVYLRDVYDHTIQVIDTVEGFRDTLSSMLDIYLSSINNRLSEVMKVLTIISTIFIPLTFIAGVYGMNFDNMPELRTRYGYFVVLGFMFTVALGMLALFRKRKWL